MHWNERDGTKPLDRYPAKRTNGFVTPSNTRLLEELRKVIAICKAWLA